MLTKKDEGKTAWAVWIRNTRIIKGIVTRVYETIKDCWYVEIHEKCSDRMINKYLIPIEDMFLKRGDAITELSERLIEYRDYYDKQVQFLSAELNKRGRKTLELPKLTFHKRYDKLHWYLGKVKMNEVEPWEKHMKKRFVLGYGMNVFARVTKNGKIHAGNKSKGYVYFDCLPAGWGMYLNNERRTKDVKIIEDISKHSEDEICKTCIKMGTIKESLQ